MAIPFYYGTPSIVNNVTSQMNVLRTNYQWIWGVALYGGNNPKNWIIPGFYIDVIGSLPEFTFIEAVWTLTGDVLRFRITPTWVGGVIDSLTWQIDVGSGYESMDGPQGNVDVRAFAPQWRVQRPKAWALDTNDPKPRTDDEMLEVRDNNLAGIIAAGWGDLYDDFLFDSFSIPGFSTVFANYPMENAIEFRVFDSMGPGDTPQFVYKITRDTARNLPVNVLITCQRESGEPFHTVGEYAVTHDGNGRLESISRIRPE